jgi:NhaP-type Na+/H+ or K+/H+ antiporter
LLVEGYQWKHLPHLNSPSIHYYCLALPGALAGMLVGMKAPCAEIIASVNCIAILMTIINQATNTKWLAKYWG